MNKKFLLILNIVCVGMNTFAMENLPEQQNIGQSEKDTVTRGEAVERFMMFASSGEISQVKKLIESKSITNVNVVSPQGIYSGMTALHLAAFNGHYHVVEFLLDQGASPAICMSEDCLSNGCATPVHLAAKKGHTLVVQALLAAVHLQDVDAALRCNIPLEKLVQGQMERARKLASMKMIEIQWPYTPYQLAHKYGYAYTAQVLTIDTPEQDKALRTLIKANFKKKFESLSVAFAQENEPKSAGLPTDVIERMAEHTELPEIVELDTFVGVSDYACDMNPL